MKFYNRTKEIEELFPVVKVSSQRDGTTDAYTQIDNLDRVRIIVK